MEQSQCDVCGGLVTPGEPPGGARVGLVCEACLETRSVRPDPQEVSASLRNRPGRFACPVCGKRLRAKVVKARIETACPSCGGLIVLAPGGIIEAPAAEMSPASEPLEEGALAAPASAERERERDGADRLSPAPEAAERSSAPPLDVPPPPPPTHARESGEASDLVATIDKGAFDALAQSDDFELLSPPPRRRDSAGG